MRKARSARSASRWLPSKPRPPRLQVQTRRVVRLFAVLGGGVSIACGAALRHHMRGGWLDAVLAGIALGMSMLPEEFSVVLTVFMAMGAWRISLARVLTRRAAADRDAGLCHRAVHRQDRHPHRKPDDDRRAAVAQDGNVCSARRTVTEMPARFQI